MPDLIDLALTAHGLESWQRLKQVTATLTGHGALFTLKGHSDAFTSTLTATADVTTPRLTFTPFAGAARGVWEPDRVTVTRVDGAEQHRADPLAALASLPPDAPWDEFHLLYFTGYSMWNFLCVPFLFTWPGFLLKELPPWSEGEQTWRRLHVTFPESVPTHCQEQVFYFDDRSLLRRVDYIAVAARLLPVAHYCYDHRDFSGLVVPTRRRAYLRQEDGTPDLGRAAFVELDISAVSVVAG